MTTITVLGQKVVHEQKYKLEIPEPDDVIDETGRSEVKLYLRNHLMQQRLELSVDEVFDKEWEWRWFVRRGREAGTFTKRLSKRLWKTFNYSIPSNTLARIGSIAREYAVVDPIVTVFDFTTLIDWVPGDFGDDGSCLWADREMMRILIGEYGAAIRFYDSENPLERKGRCLYLPVYPSSKSSSSGVLFNLYHPNLTLSSVGQAFALWSGLSYKRVKLSNQGYSGGTFYINNASGLLLDKTESTAGVKRIDLDYDEESVPQYACGHCGISIIMEERVFRHDGYHYCRRCYNRRIGDPPKAICDTCWRPYSVCKGHSVKEELASLEEVMV